MNSSREPLPKCSGRNAASTFSFLQSEEIRLVAQFKSMPQVNTTGSYYSTRGGDTLLGKSNAPHAICNQRQSGKKPDQRGRASTNPHTAFTPAANKGAAQASNVAPVVEISSISSILLLEIALFP
jgi:hypothetical protein